MSVSALEVVVDTCSFAARSPSANVTGIVYLLVKDRAFPSVQWNDFPVIILAWWLEGITQLAHGHANEYEAPFMEGPYRFTVKPVDGLIALVTLHTGEGAWSENVSFQELRASVAVAGAAAVHECRTRAWSNSDLENLGRLVGKASA
jgi:hypothetical protein